MKNKEEILKKLGLDFSKYDYYGHYFLYRVDKKSGVVESYDADEGWVKSDVDIVKKATNIFEGADDIDVLQKGDEDYIVETAMSMFEEDEE